MTTELVTVDGEVVGPEQRAPMTLFGTDDPAAVVERASAVATALASVINERRLFTSIGNKKHVQVEGWTLLGSMLGVFAEVEWSRPLENGWEARAVARTLAGNVVGAAEAMCTTNEGRWKAADPYAVRSMAQTRSVSKALRLPLGFIMHLAGYSATPAEELVEDQPEQGRATVAGRRQSAHPASAPVPPREAIAAYASEHGIGLDAIERAADAVGVPKGGRATDEQLRAVLAHLQQPSNGSAHPETALGEVGEHPTSPDALLESVLEVTGGELVQPSSEAVAAGPEATPSSGPPPKPKTPEFEALSSKERVNARAYWQTHGTDEEPETLAEQLRVTA